MHASSGLEVFFCLTGDVLGNPPSHMMGRRFVLNFSSDRRLKLEIYLLCTTRQRPTEIHYNPFVRLSQIC